MYDRILFPTDGSTGASTVTDRVLDLAEAHEATLHVLNVADTKHDSVTRIGTEIVDTLESEGEEIVASVARRASDRGISNVSNVVQGDVPEAIAAYADQSDIDLIAMPARGRSGVEEALLGSVTERVLRRASVPVLALRPDGTTRDPYRDILVPTDGSDCADEAVDLGASMASEYDATLHLLSVVAAGGLGVELGSERQSDALEERANQIVSEAADAAERASIPSVVEATERNDSVADAVREYVTANDVDLVVAGTHGRTGVERYLLGSVTEKVVRTASVPVLAVPTPEAGE